MDLREIENVNPWKHWYYLSKAQSVLRIIHENSTDLSVVVDVGAGSAFFSQFLSEKFENAEFLCVDPNYLPDSLSSAPRVSFSQANTNIQADLYLFMDVLEHVSSDVLLLKSYLDGAKIGANVLITVPAFDFLWSEHDVYLGHFRRYRRKQVIDLVESVGLKVERSYYLFSIVFPIVLLLRKFGYRKGKGSNMTEVPRFVNSLLLWINRLEGRFVKSSFFGLSVIVYATKSH